MTKEELLERLVALERDRTKHESRAETLLMERDQLIHDALNGVEPTLGAAEVARALAIDRSWPYRIRDEYPERLKRWRSRQS